uniref:Protein kinase domain-containing protein n=1 Tax=Heterorhabditis bacteriophora TaxID=37862 RepID=A0A1I7X959_HETBA
MLRRVHNCFDNLHRTPLLIRYDLSNENYVADLITASGSYSTDAHLTPGMAGSEDVHYLIDFDMAFLGDEKQKFDKTAYYIYIYIYLFILF